MLPRSVVVHSCLGFDVNGGALGQAAGVDLLVRAPPFARRAQLFASHPREVAVGAAGVRPVALVPGALNRLPVEFRLLTLGGGGGPASAPAPRALHLTLVDPDTRELVCFWRAQCAAGAPAVTRVFDLSAPLRTLARKRIPLANLWARARELCVVSSHPSLVRVRRRRLAVAARGEVGVRLALAPVPRAAAEAVFLFVLDETGAAEETFLLRIRFLEREEYRRERAAQAAAAAAVAAPVAR